MVYFIPECLLAFKTKNGNYPTRYIFYLFYFTKKIFIILRFLKIILLIFLCRIMFYRDGVGEGQLRFVIESEIEVIRVYELNLLLLNVDLFVIFY